MNNKAIFKKKIIVSLISIVISILILPLILGEYGNNFIHDYLGLILIYSLFASPFMILLGIPVNIIAGFVLKKVTRFKPFINLLLHSVPALIIGVILFNEEFFLIFIPVFISSIFFVVDTLVFLRESTSKKKYFVLIVPFIFLLTLLTPNLIDKWQFSQIQNEELPLVELDVNGEVVEITPNTCWDSDGSNGCPVDNKPYLLPIDPIGINEFNVEKEVEIKTRVHIPNSKRDYSISVFYIDGKKIKDLKVEGNEFLIPTHIQEQVVKVNITMDNSQKVSFQYGIRTGNR